MQIDWWTLALQAVNFLVLVWLLWRFLYRPVREIIAKRKALAERAFADADTVKQEAEAAKRRYEAAQAALAEEREAMLGRAREALEDERREVLAAAREDADAVIERARARITEERKTALAAVRDEVAGLAVDLASRLLREAGAEAGAGSALAEIEKRLAALPEGERKRLQKDLAAADARLEVVTAAPLAEAERARWRARLEAALGAGAKTEFATDAALIGGAELRFPHAVLALSWAEQLAEAKEALAGDERAS